MDAWELIAQYVNGLSYHSGLKFNNKAISICGYSGGIPRPWVLQTQNGRIVTAIDTTPEGLAARVAHASTVFDNRMWVIGGAHAKGNYASVLHSQDGKKWEHISDIPDDLAELRAVSFGTERNNLVTLGGYNGLNVESQAIYKTSDGRQWEQVAVQGSQWSGRDSHGALVYKNKLWVFGGWDGADDLNDVWWTDDLIHWHRALEHAPWSPRCEFGHCVWDERMWIIGGIAYGGQRNVAYDEVWFSRDGTTWERAFDFPVAVYGTHAMEFDNKIHVFGGVGCEHNIYRMNLG